jgi:hypothetical protein
MRAGQIWAGNRAEDRHAGARAGIVRMDHQGESPPSGGWPGRSARNFSKDVSPMKKLLLTAILGLAALIQVPGRTSAGAFGLFTGQSCCGGCGCCVCIRPYNAFTPVLCGTIYSDCCWPSCGPQPGHCGCGPTCGDGMPGPMVPMAFGPMMPGPIMPGAMAPGALKPGALSPAPTAPGQVAPELIPAPLKPPTGIEKPTAMPKGPTTAAFPGMMPYGMVQPAGYYPMYYPAYNYGYGYGYAPMMPSYSGYYNP